MISRQLIRRFMTSAIRRSDHDNDGIPGHNLPFPIKNKYVLTGLFCVFLGSGFSVPFLLVRHGLKKA